MAQRRKVIVVRDPCSALAAQLVAQRGSADRGCLYSPSYRPKGIFAVAMDLHKGVHTQEEYAAVPATAWKVVDVMMREKTPAEFVRWVAGINQHFDLAASCTEGLACSCCITYADALPGIRTIVAGRLLSPEALFRVAACAVVHGMEPLLGAHVDPSDVRLADCSPGDLLQLVARLAKDIQTDEAFAAFCAYPFDGLACMHLVPEFDAAFVAAARKLLRTALAQQSALDARRIQARTMAGELIAQEEEEKAAAASTKKKKSKKSKAAAAAGAPAPLSSRKLAVQQKRAVAAEACARAAVLAETARQKRMEEREAAARRMLRESRCDSRLSRKQEARADAADVAGALALLESMALEHLPEPPRAEAEAEGEGQEDCCGICMDPARGAATVRVWPCAHSGICDVCAVDAWFRGIATLQCLSCMTPVSCMTLGNGRRLGIGSF